MGRILAVILSSLAMCVPAAHAAQRSITVTGQGEVHAEPDRALVSLGIEARQLQLEQARSEVNLRVEAVLKLARELKIDPKYVRTTRIHVQPEYSWNDQTRERRLLGYFVSRHVEVDLRQLDLLGTLLERAFALRVNQISDPQLDSTRRRELEREALSKAITDARLNAEALAKAAGVKVGSPRALSAASGTVPPPVPLRGKSMAMAMQTSESASQSYRAGEMSFAASVQAEYDLVAADTSD